MFKHQNIQLLQEMDAITFCNVIIFLNYSVEKKSNKRQSDLLICFRNTALLSTISFFSNITNSANITTANANSSNKNANTTMANSASATNNANTTNANSSTTNTTNTDTTANANPSNKNANKWLMLLPLLIR